MKQQDNLEGAANTRTGEDVSASQPRDTVPPDAGPEHPGKLGFAGFVAAFKRTGKQFSQDNVTDWAAALTYYGVLSIFPAALVLVSILGMLSDNAQQTVQNTVNEIAEN